MQKPFNAEGLNLTFLLDAIYPDLSITEANDTTAACNAIPGFTPEQTSSLQRILSSSIGEALEPLLRPLSEFLSAWEKGPQFLSSHTSLTHTISPDSGFKGQLPSPDESQDHRNSIELVKSALESRASPNDCTTKNAVQPNSAHYSSGLQSNMSTVPPLSVDRVPAKRKATALDEAVSPVAKKNCTFGLAEKENSPDRKVQRCSTEVQVKQEPETVLQDSQQYPTEEHASMFLSPAPSHSDTLLMSSRGKAVAESSVDTESVETHSTSTGVGELRSLDTAQPEAWLTFAKSSAAVKALFKDEPRMDEPCPTRDYFAEKPASLVTPSTVYGRFLPRLPFGAPHGCAHIIDITRYSNKTRSSFRMADIVVTFLFNYCPDLLYAFLNFMRHPEFSLTRRETAGRGRGEFSIERSGLNVTVSDFSRLKNGVPDGSRSAVSISQTILKKEIWLWKNSMTKKS